MQTWVKFHGMVHLGSYDTDLAAPRQGQKTNDIIAKPCAVQPCTFLVYLLCHSCSFLWLLSLFLTFWSLLWTGFSLWLHSTKKGMQSQCRLEWYFWPGENKLHHRTAHVNKMICSLDHSLWSLVCCFDFGLWVVPFVRMRHDRDFVT